MDMAGSDQFELAARVHLAQFGSCASVGADSTTGFDPWFPLAGFDNQGTAAKRVCASCPVKDECLAVALTYGEDYGIWGGLTAAERRDLNRSTQNTAPAIPAERCFAVSTAA